jgi:hypothetical protein
MTLLRRLLAMLGLAPREVPDLAARVEPHFGPCNYSIGPYQIY